MADISTSPGRLRTRTGPQAVPELVDRLDRLADTGDEVSFGDLIDEIGAQGHAPLLMIVAILMVLPLGMVPGVGGALGAIAALIGIQMLLGKRGVWTPEFIRKRSLPSDRLHGAVNKLRPASKWLRRRLKIRLEVLAANRISLSIIALVLVIAGGALLVLGAIPIATPILGLPIAIFAVGILARDGAVVLAGWIVLAFAIAMIAVTSKTLMG